MWKGCSLCKKQIQLNERLTEVLQLLTLLLLCRCHGAHETNQTLPGSKRSALGIPLHPKKAGIWCLAGRETLPASKWACAAIHWLVWVQVQGSGSQQDRQIKLFTLTQLSKTLLKGHIKRSPAVLLGKEWALLINGNGNLCMAALAALLHSCFLNLQPTPSHSWWK